MAVDRNKRGRHVNQVTCHHGMASPKVAKTEVPQIWRLKVEAVPLHDTKALGGR
jgi:hypothetical protein